MASIGQTLKFNMATTPNGRNHNCMSLANELSVLATNSPSCLHSYAVVQEYLIFWANDTTATIQEGIVVSCCRNGLVYTLCTNV